MSTVGLELKNIRKEKNISLEQVAETTNIKVDYLRSIESDEFHKLPTIIHAKGFIRSYANCLGLDGLAFSKKISAIEHMEKEFNKSKVKLNKIERTFSWNEIKQELYEQFKRYRKTIVLSIIVIFFAFLIYKTGKFLITAIQNRMQNTEKQTELTAESDLKPAVEAITNDKDAKLVYPVIAKELKLQAVANTKVWVSVKIDGDLVYEGVLHPQASEYWTAKKKINLRIGNAGGLKLILNGNNLGKLGKKGEVIKDLVLTKKGMEIN